MSCPDTTSMYPLAFINFSCVEALQLKNIIGKIKMSNKEVFFMVKPLVIIFFESLLRRVTLMAVMALDNDLTSPLIVNLLCQYHGFITVNTHALFSMNSYGMT